MRKTSSRAATVLLSAILAGSLVPSAAFAVSDELNDGEGTLPPVSDMGVGDAAESWRYFDGVPDNVLLEAYEDQGVALMGAFDDVDSSYRSTWSKSDGVGKYTYRKTPMEAGTTITVPGVKEVGIDVSYYNNEKNGKYSAIDWAKVKSDGITFAVIRCGDGPSFDDPWFVKNIQAAKQQGIKVGVYLYARAQKLTGEGKSVENEVNHTLRQLNAAGIKPSDLELPIYYDMEDKSQRSLGSELLGKIAKAYCDGLQAQGYRVGIYANQDWFNNVLTDPVFSAENMQRAGWSRWVARYSWGSSSCGVSNTDMWQFTSIGLVNGTPRKYCDVNFSYVDFQATTPGEVTWEQVGNTWYLKDSADRNLVGWQRVKDKQYYLNADGSMQTGWLKLGEAWYYFGGPNDGAMKTGWQKVGGVWYYMNTVGVMQTGWQTIDGKRYYLSPSSGAMVTGTQTINGKVYVFASSGELLGDGSSASGATWVKSGGKWYLRDGAGNNKIGWQKVKGTWYYMASNGVMQTGWQKVGGTWYYLKSSGAMATGWQKIKGTWYYLKSSGAMATGWQKVGGKWYYLKSSGAMATGWQKISGVWYHLKSSGAMSANCWVGNYYLTSSGAMATNTWIGKYHVNSSGLWDKTR
ncbi:GH25 family lysozyme [Adlercreutzia sp. R21]|uniref:GH25 family lysozyme n=1 Tax=Adlercreutzia wanghongyangiae TaxID=3111451 RepID=UPI002DBE826F|nr:GH25 family lysozyme [Adlercreutzia sp. R21]MEC4184993.1 GH25 family lysozyme [Adlercreutzia sp. R21]